MKINAAGHRPNRPDELIFRVKPRLLFLLGDQLIRDANLAVFELVKNAYDADATHCSVVLEHADNPSIARIEITDDGSGMTEEILRDAWMVIGTDFRARQRSENLRSPRFGRYPLGEKGLGRLSVHKLGRFIRLVTRQLRGEEFIIEFDWDRLEAANDLDAAAVTLQRRTPVTFTGTKHGTKLEVTRLREGWARGELRRLHRAVSSLRSPFKGPTDFDVTLSAPGREDWLKGLLTAEEVNKCAVYHISDGLIQGDSASFTYEFIPPHDMQQLLKGRKEPVASIVLERKEGRKSHPLDLSEYAIGPVEFEFWLFDRDSAVLRAVTSDVKGLKQYLDENGGIRIYRDGIRVYDFGEPGNDWLNLDLRRVNTPTARTSNNQILGALRIDATTSKDLREKSNREGFIENRAYEAFRQAIISVLTHVEAEKVKDQKRLREALGKGTGQKLFEKLSDLRETLASKGLLHELEPRLKEVEREMELYRDQLLHAAVPGLSIGIMLHGAEKILEELREATRHKTDPERIKDLVERLYRSMRPVTNLLKNPGVTTTSAEILIKEAIFSTELRLKRHGIALLMADASAETNFAVRGSKQMLVASLTNLIDNAIHWMEVKSPSRKFLYLGISREIEGGPSIIVGDNGPGFGKDDPEDLVAPFFSRRNGGMGLGLYIVSEVMRANKGRLVFPPDDELSLPSKITGAVVGLQFLS